MYVYFARAKSRALLQVDERAMDARKRRGRHQPGTASPAAAGLVAANQAVVATFEKQVAAAEKQVMPCSLGWCTTHAF